MFIFQKDLKGEKRYTLNGAQSFCKIQALEAQIVKDAYWPECQKGFCCLVSIIKREWLLSNDLVILEFIC